MTPQNDYEKLDTPEACGAFRRQYQDTAFRTAYSLTGSYSQAHALTQAFFAEAEREYRGKPLPDAIELYVLSRINYLYARGETHPKAPVENNPASARKQEASPEGSVLLGQVYYVPNRELSETVTAASSDLLRFASRQIPHPGQNVQPVSPEGKESHEPEQQESGDPEMPQEEDGTAIRAVFDPEVTAFWTPDVEGESPAQVSAVLPPRSKKMVVSDSNPRSIPLTVTNTILALAAIGAVVFLISSLHIF